MTPQLRPGQGHMAIMNVKSYGDVGVAEGVTAVFAREDLSNARTPQSGRALLAKLLQREDKHLGESEAQPSPRGADQLHDESKMRMKQSALDVAVAGSHQSAPDSSVADNIHTRDRSLSGSLTPRTMTPHVWGGSGDTRSPSFRPNLLISKQQARTNASVADRHPSSTHP